MSLYRLQTSERRLQPFHSTDLRSRYQEKDLEDWLEVNPQVLVSDEPLLVIGRQVNTPVGIIDLLAVDSEGTVVIVELKRAPDQRGAIAQGLEYAAWLSASDDFTVRQIAESYLGQRKPGLSLEEAWQQMFGGDLPSLSLNEQHRVVIVVEGENDRIASVAQYLRDAGVDISLLTYNYYRTENNEEILNIDKEVGEDERSPSGTALARSSVLPTESELVNSWSPEAREAYVAFKDRMARDNITYKLRRSQISFNKQTGDGTAFICGFQGSGRNFRVYLRSDSLQSRFDFEPIAQTIKANAGTDTKVLHTDTWFNLTSPATTERGAQVADLIISEVANE